jgi:tetratricopeptide (TPR) repeat protein
MPLNPSYEQLMADALDATQRDALEESEALLRQAMALAPGAAAPHLLRAANFAHAGRHDLAEASYLACLTRAPDLAIARFQLGLLQASVGRYAVAHATWEPLLGLAEDHPIGLLGRGMLSLLMERREQACEFLRRGIACNLDNEPLNSDMRNVLARIDGETATAVADGVPAGAADVHFLIDSYRRR